MGKSLMNKNKNKSHRLAGERKIHEHWGNPAKRDKGKANTRFIANQRLVIRRLLGFTHYFAEPKGFVPKFYHSVIELPPKQWQINDKVQLIGGYCTVTYSLNSHYQPSIRYILNNKTVIPTLYQTIQTNYHSLIHEQIITQLESFDEQLWLHESYQDIASKVVDHINYFMAKQHIHFSCRLDLHASFISLPETNDSDLNDHFMHEKALRKVRERVVQFENQQQLDATNEEHEKQRQHLAAQDESLKIDLAKQDQEKTQTEIEKSKVDETAIRESYKLEVDSNLIQQNTDLEIFKIKEQERAQTEIENTKAKEATNREAYKHTLQASLIAQHEEEQARLKQSLLAQEEALQIVEAELDVETKRTEIDKQKVNEDAKRAAYRLEIEAQLITQQTEHAIFKTRELEREQLESMAYRESLKDQKSKFLQEEIELLLMHQEKQTLEQELKSEAQALNPLR